MTRSGLVVTVALEGSTDLPVVERVLSEVGHQLGSVYGRRGKDRLDEQMRAYNHAARHGHWLVVRDLDHDADCAPKLRRRLLPDPAPMMALRIAVRAVESWLLADSERIAGYLGVARARIPPNPDALRDPKAEVVTLARHSKSRDVREDMVPRVGSGAFVGPGSSSRIAEFAMRHWRPRAAARHSQSLAACLTALGRWKPTR